MKWRKSPRLKEYDYKTNGYYFVTICTALRKPWLEQYREEAEKILRNLPLRFDGLKIDYYCFMRDHLHAIFILNEASVSLAEVVRTYKALVTKTTQCKPFWEWNYYEHVIRNERALYEIRKYIQDNPEKEKIDFKAIYSCINTTAKNENKL